MLVLGLPANATMALMVRAMMIHSIQPGPQAMTSNPALFSGLICSIVDRVLLRDRRVLATALFGAPPGGGSAPRAHDPA
ncbi:MAG: tripartite tricarboxylate transporter permease, partial [Myxococcales bacterium]